MVAPLLGIHSPLKPAKKCPYCHPPFLPQDPRGPGCFEGFRAAHRPPDCRGWYQQLPMEQTPMVMGLGYVPWAQSCWC